MYDFRSKRRPTADQARGHQRRLIYLIGGLGLVLYAMWHAKDPRNWRWFQQLTQPRAVDVDTTAPADPPGPGLPADGLSGPIVVPDKRQTEKPDTSKPLAQRVRGELLSNVVDNVAGLDPRETDALYHLLEILAGAEPDAIRAAGAEPVTHLQLWEQSAAYRGKLVSMQGEIKLVMPRTFPENDYGLTTYYEVWMRPEGTTNPVVIWTLELPADFPVGDKLEEPASVTAFYYRRWWYMAGDKKRPQTLKDRLAPMLVARGVDWSPRPPPSDLRAESARFELLWWIGAGIVAAIALGMLFIRRYSRAQPADYLRARVRPDDLSDIPGDGGQRDVAAELRALGAADDLSPPDREPDHRA